MSESSQHATLADMVVCWAEHNCGFSKGPIIYRHRPEGGGVKLETPPVIGGSIPDVFIKHSDEFDCVVGEAKTPKDLERPHTKRQLLDYLGFCHAMPSSIFVFAVPWPYVTRAKNLVRLAVKSNRLFSARCVVLNDLMIGFFL